MSQHSTWTFQGHREYQRGDNPTADRQWLARIAWAGCWRLVGDPRPSHRLQPAQANNARVQLLLDNLFYCQTLRHLIYHWRYIWTWHRDTYWWTKSYKKIKAWSPPIATDNFKAVFIISSHYKKIEKVDYAGDKYPILLAQKPNGNWKIWELDKNAVRIIRFWLAII